MVTAVATAARAASDTPAGVIAVALLAAVLVFAALVYGLARWQGIEPAWWLGLRRAFVEAGWHAEAALADFADWLRVGR
jgi:hypothetical protein